MMVLAPSKPMALQCCLSSERFLVRQHIPTTFSLPLSRKFLSCSGLVCSRTRNFSSTIATASSSSKRKKKQDLSHNHVKDGEEEEGEEGEDAFELLFKQLEEDLKNDDMSFDVDDDDNNEITEEDLASFERELEDALRGDAEILQSVIDDTEKFKSAINDTETDNDPVEEDDEDDDGSEKSLKLRKWQLRKLAKALKDGRRKTSIKSLAAEVCLDRAVVLELLRDPPPNLLMMSLALPDDEPTVTVALPEKKSTETIQEETSVVPSKPESKAKVPVHVMQHKWSAQKRLKKVHVETLERVYKKTKRPTNTMISSIVHVTNLPRKRVVQWFEDKRAEEGVPDHRSPYYRTVSESV